MTIEQAVAILEAERVLQQVGCNGPDCSNGSAWYNYVHSAADALIGDPLFCGAFGDLHLLEL